MIRRAVEAGIGAAAVYVAYKALRKDAINQIKANHADDELPRELPFDNDEEVILPREMTFEVDDAISRLPQEMELDTFDPTDYLPQEMKFPN